METTTLIYPSTPGNVPESVTSTSAAFKKEVTKVMSAIFLFFIVYVILVALAVALAVGAVYFGITLIIAFPRFFTIMLGLGLTGLGVMILFFLVKFIFAVSRFDRSQSIEIKEQDHPRLFEFIRRVTMDTHTPFPKRIYLSPEVNACVFYDSSFWSMFLPVKKNLQIGLGLVNSVNLSEFKAIVAHEFGHFSQRSMKLGSFVYNVNRVIWNMLFENNSYGRSLEKWASISDYFAIFASLTARIVIGIQWVLRQMYALINKSYMRLSREMEFHADAVAASVSGSENCIAALRRIELGSASYSAAIAKCNELLKEKCITGNLYMNQQVVSRQHAQNFGLALQNNLPVVKEELLKNLNVRRVNFKDQWASHPSMEERAEHLNGLGVPAEISHDSAWILFNNPDQWQQKLTGKIYGTVELSNELRPIDTKEFENLLQQENELYSFPEVYKGFYDKRMISILNIAELSYDVSIRPQDILAFDDIFNEVNSGLQQKIGALQMDVDALKAIAAKEVLTKTFDFEGVKYPAGKAESIAASLQSELNEMKDQQEKLDKAAYRYFYSKALQTSADRAAKLKQQYTVYFAGRAQADLFLNNVNHILQVLRPIYVGRIEFREAHNIINEVKTAEKTLKRQLNNWLQDGAFHHAPVFKKEAIDFLNSYFEYIDGNGFRNDQLNVLHHMIDEGWRHISEFLFRKFKALVELQLAAN